MKTVGLIVRIIFLWLFLVGAGCEPASSTAKLPPETDGSFDVSIYTHYAPVKVDIIPLTEFAGAGDDEEGTRIDVFVSLLDRYGCQIKAPGVFRFELYERVQRSAEPKGRRVVIWTDIDLTDAANNNEHWRDFLRAYEFGLDFEPDSNRSYILQVTCLCPNGKRLLAEFDLKQAE